MKTKLHLLAALVDVTSTAKTFLTAVVLALALAPCAQATVTNIAYYRFGEYDPGAANGVVATSTTNQLGGVMTLQNGPAYSASVSVRAARAVGSTVGLQLPPGSYGTNAIVSTLTNNFGIELWVNPDATNTTQYIAFNGSPSQNGWGIGIVNGQYVGFLGPSYLYAYPAAPGVWTHVAWVRDNGFVRAYVNGVPTGASLVNPIAPTGRFAVGARPDSLAQDQFAGVLDEVRVFTFAPGTFSSSDLLLNRGLVTSTADDGGPGTLRTVLASSVDGDTVDATGISGTITLLSGELLVTNSVTILGPGPNQLAINGNYPNTTNRVFRVTSSVSVTIAGLTITNGFRDPGDASDYNGGGIYNQASSLTVSNCTVSGNISGLGGGICHSGGTLAIIDSTLSGNSGYNAGGGIYNGGTLTVSNCTFTGNECSGSGGGGGIYDGGVATVTNSTLNHNTNSIWGGGGISVYGGSLTLINSTLSGNYAGGKGGGGIWNQSTLNVLNSTLSDNSAVGRGGGIYNDRIGGFGSGPVTLTLGNSTLSGNSASIGLDIANFNGTAGSPVTLTISSTILHAGNPGTNIVSEGPNIVFTSLGYNLCSDDGSGLLNATGDQINTDPLLGPLQNNGGPTLTHALLPGSPAIDHGTNFSASATDQRGFARVVGSAADIGAVEANSGPVVTTTADNGAGSLRQVLAQAPPGATILFAPGLSGQTITLTSGELVLSNNLTIDASDLPNGIALDGNHASPVFQVNYATVTLNSLTITNAYNSGAYYSGYGGGIGSYYGHLTLNNCKLVNNQSAGVAGALYASFGSLTMNGTIVSGNTGAQDSAIYFQDQPATLVDCTISGNTCAGLGGALVGWAKFDNIALSVVNSTFSSNTTSYGDGAAIGLTAFSGWTASGGLTNCTVVSNMVVQAGQPGAIYLLPVGGTATLALHNSIVSGNLSGGAPGDITGTVTAGSSFNLIGVGGGLTNGVNGNQVGVNDPVLAPLGNYGGHTRTMLPLPGSPAIDTGGASTLTTDQRGFPRVQGAAPDIGAVESGNRIPGYAGVVTVNDDIFNGLDNGGVSLREAVVLSAPNTTITFDPGLSGSTILLTSEELLLNTNLTIDASSLSGGIAVSGNYNSRVFEVSGGGTAVLNSLQIRDGYASGDSGGGLRNSGNLTLNRCTVSGNISEVAGGGIASPSGALTLNECTMSGNAVPPFGIGGGAIIFGFTGGTLTVNQSTLSGNIAPLGGGIYNAGGSLTGANSIVAGNSQDSGGDVEGGTLTGVNLTSGNPSLAPLGNYGGSTPTMPPMPGSPAIDTGNDAAAIQFTTDQRGYPRLSGAHVDIGAVEAQIASAGNPPMLMNSVWSSGGGSGATFQFSFTNSENIDFTALTSTNVALPLTNWTILGNAIQVTPGVYQFTDPGAANDPQRFYRVVSP